MATWIQSCFGSSTAGVTATFTTANLSAGSTMIACVSTDSAGAGNVTQVKDGSGNQFIKIIDKAQGGANGAVSLWALNTPAGDVGTKPVISLTETTSANTSLVVQEVSGIVTAATAGAFTDGTAGTSSGSSGTGSIGPPAYSSGVAGEYLVYVYGDDGTTTTFTQPGGYTLDPSNVQSSTRADLGIAYKDSTGTTETGQWAITLGGTADWALILVAFQVPGGIGAGTPTVPYGFPQTRTELVPGGGGGRIIRS